jgi:hypothetical protein
MKLRHRHAVGRYVLEDMIADDEVEAIVAPVECGDVGSLDTPEIGISFRSQIGKDIASGSVRLDDGNERLFGRDVQDVVVRGRGRKDLVRQKGPDQPNPSMGEANRAGIVLFETPDDIEALQDRNVISGIGEEANVGSANRAMKVGAVVVDRSQPQARLSGEDPFGQSFQH